MLNAFASQMLKNASVMYKSLKDIENKTVLIKG